MYNVSEEFLDALENKCRSTQLILYVYEQFGGTCSAKLTKNDFIVSSLKISKQANNSNGLTSGGCCIGTCDFTLTQRGMNKLRDNNLLNAKIIVHPVYWILNSDGGSSEDFDESDSSKCSLGYFLISKRGSDDYTCDVQTNDFMSMLDKELTDIEKQELTTLDKTIDDWAYYCCEKCSDYAVTLEYSGSDNIVNDDCAYSLEKDNNISTWRDLIGWLSVLTASFATFNKFGRLQFKGYSTGDTVYSIPRSMVINPKLDYKPTKVSGYKSSVAGFSLSDGIFVDKTDYNPVVLYVSEIPFLRALQTADAQVIDQGVVDKLTAIYSKFKAVSFTSGSLEFTGNPALELGDCVSVSRVVISANGSKKTENVTMLISSMQWSYQGNMTITSPDCSDVVKKVSSQTKKSSDAMDSVADNMDKVQVATPASGVVDLQGYVGCRTYADMLSQFPRLLTANSVTIDCKDYCIKLPETFNNFKLNMAFRTTMLVQGLGSLLTETVQGGDGNVYQIKDISVSWTGYIVPFIRCTNDNGSSNGDFSIAYNKLNGSNKIAYNTATGEGTDADMSYYNAESVLSVTEDGNGYSGYSANGNVNVKLGLQLSDTTGDGHALPHVIVTLVSDSATKKADNYYNSASYIKLGSDVWNKIYNCISINVDTYNSTFISNESETGAVQNLSSSQQVANTIANKADNQMVINLNNSVTRLVDRIIILEAEVAKLKAGQN